MGPLALCARSSVPFAPCVTSRRSPCFSRPNPTLCRAARAKTSRKRSLFMYPFCGIRVFRQPSFSCLRRRGSTASDKLSRQLHNPPALEACCRQCRLIGLEGSVIACKRRAVGIAGLELNGVRVTRSNNDRTPMIEGRIEVNDRRLLPPVRRSRAGERGTDLVDESSLGPEFAGRIEELFQLCRRQTVTCGRAEDNGIGPKQILVRSL